MHSILARRLGAQQRGYATLLEQAQNKAREASKPLAVRNPPKQKPTTATHGRRKPVKRVTDPDGLGQSQRVIYERLLSTGKLPVDDESGEVQSTSEWVTARRARPLRRVRGISGHTDPAERIALGQKIYLPNVIFRLVRNQTPTGQPYNPYEATFRVPLSITKTDVRSYLHSVYGVETTYVRTDVYRAPMARNQHTAQHIAGPAHKTYKRAVVGLVKPFYYPQAMEDMSAKEREERKKYLDDNFGINAFQDMRKEVLLRMTRAGSKDWKWRHGTVAKRSTILKAIMERRTKRELGIEEAVKDLRAKRETGEEILRV